MLAFLQRVALSTGLSLSVSVTAAPQTDPIRVGSVSTLTGPGSTVAWRAAKAYFDAVNAAGGVKGRRIEYEVLDDRADPQAARQAGMRLVNDPGVVALAGGSSVMECAVNHASYAQAGLMSIPGGGVDRFCFESPAIAPVNAGPYVSTANALTFARDVLKHERLCVVAPALPGMVEPFREAVERWAAARKTKPPAMDIYELAEPLDKVIRRVSLHGCHAVVYAGPDGPAIDWIKTARPAMPDADQVFLTSAYTNGVLRAVGSAGDGIFVLAEFEPWSGSSLQLLDWRRLMLNNNVEASSLSQGGYLAAQVLVKVMRGIDGPINRASVTKALQNMQPIANPLVDEPFVFGPGRQHQPHRSAIPMRLSEGRWRVFHAQWIRVSSAPVTSPAAGRSPPASSSHIPNGR